MNSSFRIECYPSNRFSHLGCGSVFLRISCLLLSLIISFLFNLKLLLNFLPNLSAMLIDLHDVVCSLIFSNKHGLQHSCIQNITVNVTLDDYLLKWLLLKPLGCTTLNVLFLRFVFKKKKFESPKQQTANNIIKYLASADSCKRTLKEIINSSTSYYCPSCSSLVLEMWWDLWIPPWRLFLEYSVFTLVLNCIAAWLGPAREDFCQVKELDKTLPVSHHSCLWQFFASLYNSYFVL